MLELLVQTVTSNTLHPAYILGPLSAGQRNISLEGGGGDRGPILYAYWDVG